MRRDDGEPRYCYYENGFGAPVHHAITNTREKGNNDVVFLTEGELKASVVAQLTGKNALGVPGVTHWRKALLPLAQLGAKKVAVAFDWPEVDQKYPVFQQLESCCLELQSSGYEVELATWDDFSLKGIDDLLAAGMEPKFMRGPEVQATLQKCFQNFGAAAPAGGKKACVTDSLQPASQGIEVNSEACRDDPRFEYLWKGFHGKYLNDNQRSARINSVKDAWRFIPSEGLIPQYVCWVLPTTDAPPIFHVAASLVLCGHLLNRRVWLRAGNSRLYPNLWLALIAGSSKQRKSTAIEPVLSLLREDASYARTLMPKVFTMESLYLELGKILKSPDEVANCRTNCEEELKASSEYLNGVGLFHVDELGGFLSTFDKSYNEGGKTILTEWYDCPSEWHKTTKTQGVYYVWRPTISILGASTLQWLLENCKESDLMGGFLPRWLFVSDQGTKDFTLSLRDPGNEVAYSRVKIEIAKLKALHGEMTLCVEAENMYWHWRQSVEQNTADRLGGWVSRLGTYALKLSMVYQAAINPGRTHQTPPELLPHA